MRSLPLLTNDVARVAVLLRSFREIAEVPERKLVRRGLFGRFIAVCRSRWPKQVSGRAMTLDLSEELPAILLSRDVGSEHAHERMPASHIVPHGRHHLARLAVTDRTLFSTRWVLRRQEVARDGKRASREQLGARADGRTIDPAASRQRAGGAASNVATPGYPVDRLRAVMPKPGKGTALWASARYWYRLPAQTN